MTPLEVIAALAQGERPVAGVLHSCRFEGLGTEAYGVEGIFEQLGVVPFAVTSAAAVVATRRHVAVFEGERAIFADLFEGNIGRLWLIGPDASAGAETGVAVPFDPDLDQAGGDVFVGVGDHPDLAGDAVARVTAIGHKIVDGRRARAFVLRAFGTGQEGAALFAVFRLAPGRHEGSGFALAAAHWGDAGHRVVRDLGGKATLAGRRWTPRIGG